MQKGFSVIELLAALVISAVVITVGVPSFRNMIDANRMVAQTNMLITQMHLARSEAVKRNRRVTICASTNLETCSGSVNWANGWIIIVTMTGEVIRTHQPIHSSMAMIGTLPIVTYNPKGNLL